MKLLVQLIKVPRVNSLQEWGVDKIYVSLEFVEKSRSSENEKLKENRLWVYRSNGEPSMHAPQKRRKERKRRERKEKERTRLVNLEARQRLELLEQVETIVCGQTGRPKSKEDGDRNAETRNERIKRGARAR